MINNLIIANFIIILMSCRTATKKDNLKIVINETTPIKRFTNNSKPKYKFYSNKKGEIKYNSECTSSTTTVNKGENTLVFKKLSDGTYNCTFTVSDNSNNPISINIPTFTIDTTPPQLLYTNPKHNNKINFSQNITIGFDEKIKISDSKK